MHVKFLRFTSAFPVTAFIIPPLPHIHTTTHARTHTYTTTRTHTHTLPHAHAHTHTQCARREDEQYIGELLLGLKFTPEDTGDDLEEGMEELVVNGDSHSGQLQVHVVEGAGLFDDESRKPFNAFVKWLVGCLASHPN